MSIGPDIKEVINEVGSSFTIVRDSGNVTGEFLHFRANAQVTKPFIREFFLEAAFVYDTVVAAGDIVLIDVTGNYYMVMNKTAELFENQIIRYACVLYKCNVFGAIFRPVKSSRDGRYRSSLEWQTVRSFAPALITASLYGNMLDINEQFGVVGVKSNDLYLPSSYGCKSKDRYWISHDEYYMIEHISGRQFESVSLCQAGNDTRDETITTTTSTTSSTTSSTTTTTA